MSKSEVIFGNRMSTATVRKAEKSKKKYAKKFGDDSSVDYKLKIEKNKSLYDLIGLEEIRIAEDGDEGSGAEGFDNEKGIIVGNIRMGFGHYRIAMAFVSCAKAMGYKPYWMDLNSYKQTTGGKVIAAQNDLYSMGSRLSGKIKLFNKLVWEPLNYEGFRKLSYNSSDQKNAELMTPVFKNVPKDIPFIGTHVWPSQAAVHAGMSNVVNAIPDNWPMALHLAEGALHTIQTHMSYQGYRILNGMNKDKVNNPMGAEDLIYTGHYIDHELVSNIDYDCDKRIARANGAGPIRFLLTIGGAGAQKEIFSEIIKHLLPLIKEKKAALYINVGDYMNVWNELKGEIAGLNDAKTFFNDFEGVKNFAAEAIDGNVEGVYAFCSDDIFEAVYTTNLLMRSTDVLVTKPSELSFYPVPKLFIKRVGGHEKWGAIHSAEIGDGSLECEDTAHTIQMVDMFIDCPDMLMGMCDNIKRNNKMHIYDGAYEVVKKAMERKGK